MTDLDRVPVDRAVLRSTCGSAIDLDVSRWRRDADLIELALLDQLADPIIDVGCGPGRIVGALAEAGRVALGVDVSIAALSEARLRGAPVLDRSVFAPLPGEGRWASVVLLDGNIGIGGDPVALLRRAGALLGRGGVVLTEVEPPGSPTSRLTVRFEDPTGAGPWFPWARVAAGEVGGLEFEAGLVPLGVERHGDRWFSRAVRP